MWDAEKVISIPAKKVENWMLPEMPGMHCRSVTIDFDHESSPSHSPL